MTDAGCPTFPRPCRRTRECSAGPVPRRVHHRNQTESVSGFDVRRQVGKRGGDPDLVGPPGRCRVTRPWRCRQPDETGGFEAEAVEPTPLA